MKIYMKKSQSYNKVSKNPSNISKSLDKIYLGALKSYIISICGSYVFFSLKKTHRNMRKSTPNIGDIFLGSPFRVKRVSYLIKFSSK